MTNPAENEKLKPCPFCGDTPGLPDGDGTQYEIICDCGHSMSCVQICDLMTSEERCAANFTEYRYADEFVERAKIEAIAQWNNRAALEQDCGEVGEVVDKIGTVEIPEIVATFDGLYLIPTKPMNAGEHLMAITQHLRMWKGVKTLTAKLEAVEAEMREIKESLAYRGSLLFRAEAERDAILQQARSWASEAKTQQSTVKDVGALLGQIPDWGDIVGAVSDVIAERDALKASAPKWIAALDRLPDRDHGTVAVLTEDGDTLTAWATYWNGASTDFAYWTFPHGDDEGSVVTHWAELPSTELLASKGD